MASKRNVQIIAIEEHFSDHEVIETLGMKQPPAMAERLGDLGEKRLEAMDAAGVDVQVLSLNAPGTQQCDRQTSVRLARGVNDRLAQAIKANPDRFSGFASLPTPDPLVAADELSRAVNELGLKGAMVHGLTNGEFLDERNTPWKRRRRACGWSCQACSTPIPI
jgi:predicted TIM-barrel fold metal-dependent hydrolase